MLTADQPPVLFIHVPKTGGSSITSMLHGLMPSAKACPAMQHMTLAEALEWKPDLADAFVFGIVRNPWARMVSWWSMIRAAADRAAHGSVEDERYFRRLPIWRAVRDADDFDDFVERICPEFPRLSRPQLDYLRAPLRAADYIGRAETLDEAAAYVLARLGLPATTLPRVNTSRHGGHRDYYTSRSRRSVERLFAVDIDAFGYRF